MNTKLINVEVNPEYAELFSYKSKDEKIGHNAQMISYRILSEVEKICESKRIKKKDLADMVGTSRSYITQLFRGTKQVNMDIMARFEDALDISFNIRGKLNEDSNEQFLAKQLPVDFFNNNRIHMAGFVMYCFKGNKQNDNTSELVSLLKTENKSLQKAG
jgi:transcriptional regulator with XRE-family HTH domain